MARMNMWVLAASTALAMASSACDRDRVPSDRSVPSDRGVTTRDGTTTLGSAAETMDVRAALTVDSRVDASNINVDTDASTKTVTLKGRVPTAEQRTLAGQIAGQKAVGYRVVNDLTVGN